MGKELCSSSLSHLRCFYTSSCFSEGCALQGIMSYLKVPCSQLSSGWQPQRQSLWSAQPALLLLFAFSILLSCKYTFIGRIQEVMQAPKSTVWNSGSITEHRTKTSHHHSIPSLKRLLVWGKGSQWHQFCEAVPFSDLRSIHTPCSAHHWFPSVSNTSYTIIIPSIGSYSARIGSSWTHLKLQRLSRWIEYIIFWAVWDHDPTLTSFKLYFIISIYFVIFFVEET